MYARARKMTGDLIGAEEDAVSAPSSSVSVGLYFGLYRQHEQLHSLKALYCLYIAEDVRSPRFTSIDWKRDLSAYGAQCGSRGPAKGTLLYVALNFLIITYCSFGRNALIRHDFPSWASIKYVHCNSRSATSALGPSLIHLHCSLCHHKSSHSSLSPYQVHLISPMNHGLTLAIKT